MAGREGDLALAEARLWIGTAYLHQASHRGIGTDCLGLVRGVWRRLYGAEPAEIPAYTRDWDAAAGQDILWQAAERWLVAKPLSQSAAGDVLLFRMQATGAAKHLGLQGEIGENPSFVHAYSAHAVLESRLTPPWGRRIVARFGWPERR